MKKSLKALIWFVQNILLCLLAWAAVQGSVGAGNLLIFVCWFLAILMFVGSTFAKQINFNASELERSVPQSVSTIFDLVVAGFLVWHGWWFTAIAVVIYWICNESLHNSKKKKTEEKENN